MIMDLIYFVLEKIAPSQLSNQSLEIVLGVSTYLGLALLVFVLINCIRRFF